MLIWSPAPRATSTRLGTVLPGFQLRLEVAGLGTPAGHSVGQLIAVVSVAVTLRTTAIMPPDGRPPWPSSPSVRVPPAPSGEPLRVSRILAGVTAVNAPRPGTTE